MHHDDRSDQEELIDAGYYLLGPHDGRRLILSPGMRIPPQLPVDDLSGIYVWQGDHYRWTQLFHRRTQVWSLRQVRFLYWRYLVHGMPAFLIIAATEGTIRGGFRHFVVGAAYHLGIVCGTMYLWLPLVGIPAACLFPFFTRAAKRRKWWRPWIATGLAGLGSAIAGAAVLEIVGVMLGIRAMEIPLGLLGYPFAFVIAPLMYGSDADAVTESHAERALEERMTQARAEWWVKFRRDAVAAGYGRGGKDGRGG